MYIWLAIYQSALLQGSYCHFNLIAGLYSYMFIAFIRSKKAFVGYILHQDKTMMAN